MLLLIDIETNYFIEADSLALKTLGYTIDEMLMLNPIDLNLQYFIEDGNIFVNGEKFSIDKDFEIITNIKKKSGFTFSCKISGQVENPENKQIIKLILEELTESKIEEGVLKFLPIIEKKGLPESESELNDILNNLPFIAWLKDKDFRYVTINEQFVSI